MARVRLHSGGISPGQVRLGRRGASERLRAPCDDINSADRSQTAAVCGWCGTSRQVDPSLRPRRCSACRADEQQVAAAAAKLKGAGLQPLQARVPDGTRLAKVRRQGDAARARLAERRKSRSAKKAASPAQPSKPAAKTSPSPAGRRQATTAGERRAARARLVARVARIERELAAPKTAPHRRDLLREQLDATKGLLRNWDGTRLTEGDVRSPL